MRPRGVLGVIGVMLALVALYLLLEHAGGASQIFSTLAASGMALFGTLQGRTTSAYGMTVGAPT